MLAAQGSQEDETVLLGEKMIGLPLQFAFLAGHLSH